MSYSPIPSDLLVADIDWLTPDLAVGGDLSSDPNEAIAQARWLEQQGVTDIIDVRGEWDDADLLRKAGVSITYHTIPTDDHGGELDYMWWERGITLSLIVAENGGRAFVHCHMGVNRGPSMALAILFHRGMDPLEAFTLLRTRRPQAFAIYAPQYLRQCGRREDAKALEELMERECDHDALVATIGRIRKAESGGRYRFPLQQAGIVCSESDDPEPEPQTMCDGSWGSCSTLEELFDLMHECHGDLSTELPVDWVRSLIRKIRFLEEQAERDLPSESELAALSEELDEWLDELGAEDS